MRVASGIRSVVGAVQYTARHGHAERAFAAAVRQLEAHYRPLLPSGCAVQARWLPAARTGVVLIEDESASSTMTPESAWAHPVVVGLPLSPAGPATAQDVQRALTDPARDARELAGVFVLASVTDESVRLVTSPTLVHTLTRVAGTGRVAVANRAWAAHLLAEVTPRLREEAIAEFVFLDYVLGADELLRDAVVLADAHVVDIRAGIGAGHDGSWVEWSYWSQEERFAPGPPTDAARLRAALVEAVRPAAKVPGVALGLTAGRDSTLVADCLAASGLDVATFTLGTAHSPEPRRAAAVARSLGWSHKAVPPVREAPRWSRMVELSRWTEGAQPGSALLDPQRRWSARDVTWLAGSGGEIGRAFYWARLGDPERWPREFVTGVRARVAPAAATVLTDRLDAALAATHRIGRPRSDAADLLYARERMGKWLARLLPQPQFRHVLPAYLSPALVRALLDIPLAERRTAAVFDAALAGGVLPTRVAVAPPSALSRRVGYTLATVRQRRSAARLQAATAAVGPDPVTRAVLGEQWWQRTCERAAHAPWAKRQLWNAVAVEALATAIGGGLPGRGFSRPVLASQDARARAPRVAR